MNYFENKKTFYNFYKLESFLYLYWLILKSKKMSEQIKIPTSGAGLVRYFDEYKSKIQMKPAMVVLLIVMVVAFEILLRLIK